MIRQGDYIYTPSFQSPTTARLGTNDSLAPGFVVNTDSGSLAGFGLAPLAANRVSRLGNVENYGYADYSSTLLALPNSAREYSTQDYRRQASYAQIAPRTVRYIEPTVVYRKPAPAVVEEEETVEEAAVAAEPEAESTISNLAGHTASAISNVAGGVRTGAATAGAATVSTASSAAGLGSRLVQDVTGFGSQTYQEVLQPIGIGVAAPVLGAGAAVGGVAVGAVSVCRGVFGTIPVTIDWVGKPTGSAVGYCVNGFDDGMKTVLAYDPQTGKDIIVQRIMDKKNGQAVEDGADVETPEPQSAQPGPEKLQQYLQPADAELPVVAGSRAIFSNQPNRGYAYVGDIPEAPLSARSPVVRSPNANVIRRLSQP